MAQSKAVVAGREAVELATTRYREGKDSYYEVLEAQQQLFPAENSLSRIEASRRLVVIQLYQALGGGWSLKDSNWSGANPDDDDVQSSQIKMLPRRISRTQGANRTR